MNKIKKYIDSFLKEKEINRRYSMTSTELSAINKALEHKRFETIANTFDYGYAKGYRAAVAEMKSGNRTKANKGRKGNIHT